VTEPQPRRRLASLAGLFFALVVPAVTTALPGNGNPPAGIAVQAILINEVFMWGLTLIVLALMLFWERRPFASIGLVRPTTTAFQTGAAVTVPLLALAAIAGTIIQAFGPKIETDAQAALVVGLPLWLQLVAALSAGFTEEVLFRGYSIERVTELTGRRWLGAAIPVVVFGAVHMPFWGVGHALVAGLTGLWLTLIYLWRHNLWINITAHALLDTLAFIGTDIAATHGLTNV
jgi:membrane protease YdiL (CAAX protease family)